MNPESTFSAARQRLLGDEIVLEAINTAESAAAVALNTSREASPHVSSSSSGQKESASYPWILHPAIDLFFCCGGMLWLLVGAYYTLGLKLEATTILTLSILGNVLTSDTHQPATLFRVYGSPRTRRQVGTIVTLFGLLVIGLAAAGLFSKSITGILLKITVAWSFQHLLAQVYGIFLIYCYKRQYILSKYEKQSLSYLIYSCIAVQVIGLLSRPIGEPLNYAGIDTPYWGQLPACILVAARLALQICTVWFVFMVVRKWKKEGKLPPLPALLTLMTGLMVPLINVVPLFGIFVQNFFHSTQYNVVTTAYFLKEKGLPDGMPLSKISSQLLSKNFVRYFGFLLLLGLVLSVCIPVTFVMMGFAATAPAVVYCALNLHHYFTDAAIWRLRDPVVRKLLIS